MTLDRFIMVVLVFTGTVLVAYDKPVWIVGLAASCFYLALIVKEI